MCWGEFCNRRNWSYPSHFWTVAQVALVVKNPPTNAGDIRDAVRSLSQKDPLEEGMATHSSILSWRIPWREEPGGLQSIELQRAGHNWSNLACSRHKEQCSRFSACGGFSWNASQEDLFHLVWWSRHILVNMPEWVASIQQARQELWVDFQKL